jgi:hypothetical protein
MRLLLYRAFGVTMGWVSMRQNCCEKRLHLRRHMLYCGSGPLASAMALKRAVERDYVRVQRGYLSLSPDLRCSKVSERSPLF